MFLVANFNDIAVCSNLMPVSYAKSGAFANGLKITLDTACLISHKLPLLSPHETGKIFLERQFSVHHATSCMAVNF